MADGPDLNDPGHQETPAEMKLPEPIKYGDRNDCGIDNEMVHLRITRATMDAVTGAPSYG
jgi:hypothetical protein